MKESIIKLYKSKLFLSLNLLLVFTYLFAINSSLFLKKELSRPEEGLLAQAISSTVIENLTDSVSENPPYTATIEWTTNSTTTSTFEYGETESYGIPVAVSGTVDGGIISNSVQIDNLNCETTYYYNIIATDSDTSEETGSASGSFTTGDCTKIYDVNENTSSNSVILQWKTRTIASTGLTEVIHSTTTHPITNPIPQDTVYESFSTDMETFVASHQAELTGLECDTTYYYSVLLYDHGLPPEDPALNYDDSFTTDPCSEVNMSISSDQTSITFTFDIDELPQDQSAEYGTDENYGGSQENISNPNPNSIKISNLSCGTQYYYSITASQSYDEGGEILIAEAGTVNTEACSTNTGSGGGRRGGGGGGSSSNNNNDDKDNNTYESGDVYNDTDVVIEKLDEDVIVKIIQIFLNVLGFNVALNGPGSYGFETKFFGNLTEAALKKYQKSKDINITGNIDVGTVRSLVNDMFPFIETVDDKKWNEKLVLAQVGDSGYITRFVQILLNSLGYAVTTSGSGSEDNETEYFGSLTEAALKKYQESNGIETTGNIDVITLRYLISEMFPFINNVSDINSDENQICEAEEYETEQRFYCGTDLSGKDIVNSICGSRVKLNLFDISKGGISGGVDINTTPCQKAESALMILKDNLSGAEKALADHLKEKNDLLKSCTANDWEEFKNKLETEIKDYKEQIAVVEKYKAEICGVAECKRLNEQLQYYTNELKKLSPDQDKTRRMIQNEIDALNTKKSKLNCK